MWILLCGLPWMGRRFREIETLVGAYRDTILEKPTERYLASCYTIIFIISSPVKISELYMSVQWGQTAYVVGAGAKLPLLQKKRQIEYKKQLISEIGLNWNLCIQQSSFRCFEPEQWLHKKKYPKKRWLWLGRPFVHNCDKERSFALFDQKVQKVQDSKHLLWFLILW